MEYKLSKSDWENIGQKMGWLKVADSGTYGLGETGDFGIPSPSGGPKDGGEGTGKEKEVKGDIIRIICPNRECDRVLAVPSNARGKLVRCRGCGANIRIPQRKEKDS
jgi:ribosomal protein S27E